MHGLRIMFYLSTLGTSEMLLETLTDITHEYFQQITTHLRSAADNRLLNGYTGFPVSQFMILKNKP